MESGKMFSQPNPKTARNSKNLQFGLVIFFLRVANQNEIAEAQFFSWIKYDTIQIIPFKKCFGSCKHHFPPPNLQGREE